MNPRKKKKALFTVGLVIYSLLLAGGGYSIGWERGSGPYKAALEKHLSEASFYAEILEIQGQTLHVKGLEVNDLNHRGEYVFTVEDSTEITRLREQLSLADLKIGDRIAVTYTGAVLETEPAQLQDVVSIQVLNEEA